MAKKTTGIKAGMPRMAKSQAEAEKFYDENPDVRTYTNEYTGQTIPTGPMTKSEYQNAAERAASKRSREMGAGPTMKKGGSVKSMSKDAMKAYASNAKRRSTPRGY